MKFFIIYFQPDYDDIEANGRGPAQFPRGKSDKGKEKKYGKHNNKISDTKTQTMYYYIYLYYNAILIDMLVD